MLGTLMDFHLALFTAFLVRRSIGRVALACLRPLPSFLPMCRACPSLMICRAGTAWNGVHWQVHRYHCSTVHERAVVSDTLG